MRRRVFYSTSIILLGTMLQLVTGVLSPVWGGLFVGVLQSFLVDGAWHWLDTTPSSRMARYGTGALGLAGIVSGGLLRSLLIGGSANQWQFDGGAALTALLTSSLLVAYHLRHHRNYAQGCNICGRRFTGSASHCPRCHFRVCARTSCWDEKRLRCTDCDQLQSPLLLLEGTDWWTKRLGERLGNGACYHCRSEAADCDLRQCGQCLKAMCTSCWDLENGGCIRCGWVMPALPEALAGLLAEEPVDQATTGSP